MQWTSRGKESHMIYVNQKQLDQVEYLIEQSSRGHHVLFDLEVIREVFARGRLEAAQKTHKAPKKSKRKLEDAAEKHIEKLIMQPTLVSKRAYLENLDFDTFEHVVRTYFSIVENNIFEDLKFCQ